ncbi:PP2C family protein-serine/threonine phosphatase [Rubritalea marina]|uniref:PP2C family protein-serine/threonine phosphatase n=1 Tax=Rubritalea marina TaxID=361055 RepID=UPI00037088AA|nr:PP2C family serine/threonine-protein phosphatase [Rubritalea marina]
MSFTPPNFRWHAESISGTRKKENDDSFLVFRAGVEGATELPSIGDDVLDKEDMVFAVSDGMGGGNAGYLASSLILQTFAFLIPKTFASAAQGFHPDYLELLEQQVGEIHQSINDKAASSEEFKGMGATLSLAWFTPENMYLAHVGDSRIYLHRNGKTQQVTDDHSFSWRKLQRGDTNERQYRNDPKRSVLCEVIGGGHRKVRPQIAAIPYQIGDRIMICSDGIIDGCWEKHVHQALSQNADSTSHPAKVLMNRAIENAGSDDTTLIVLDIR